MFGINDTRIPGAAFYIFREKLSRDPVVTSAKSLGLNTLLVIS